MSERTERFPSSEIGKVFPGSSPSKEEKAGKMPSGRSVRESAKEGEETTISRLSQRAIASTSDRGGGLSIASLFSYYCSSIDSGGC